MYHDNKYDTMSKTAKNIYARSFMIEIPEIHRTIEHRNVVTLLNEKSEYMEFILNNHY